MEKFKHTEFSIKMELHLRQFTNEDLVKMEDEFIILLNSKFCPTQADCLSAINRELRKRNGLN